MQEAPELGKSGLYNNQQNGILYFPVQLGNCHGNRKKKGNCCGLQVFMSLLSPQVGQSGNRFFVVVVGVLGGLDAVNGDSTSPASPQT